MKRILSACMILLSVMSAPVVADYYGSTHAGYLINGDYSDTSTGGTPIPGVIGSQFERTKPTNNLFKGYANLNTGEMKSYLAVNNYQGDNWYADGDVQDYLEDNFLITGGAPGNVVDVILAYQLQGTLRVTPQNTSSTNQYGYASVQARMYGGNIDNIDPDWMNKSLLFYYQDGYVVNADGLTEGADYTLSGDTITVDTTIPVTAQMTVGEWQNVIWYLDITGSAANTNLDPIREVDIEADFWDTAITGISLAPGYEGYTITRESGLPEPVTMLMFIIGAALIRRR